jgi:hypothetical protein
MRDPRPLMVTPISISASARNTGTAAGRSAIATPPAPGADQDVFVLDNGERDADAGGVADVLRLSSGDMTTVVPPHVAATLNSPHGGGPQRRSTPSCQPFSGAVAADARTAVDAHDLAGDETRLLGEQEGDGGCELVRAPEPSHGNTRQVAGG